MIKTHQSQYIRRVACLVFTALVFSLPVFGGASANSREFVRHLRYLSSDELKGRGNSTPEIHKAAEYIAENFKALGLRPAGTDGYYQHFEVTTGHHLGPGNWIKAATPGNAYQFEMNKDYVLLSFGPDDGIAGTVVFAGFGITAPEYHYDDYASVDVRGKVVLIFEHEPQEETETGPFGGRQLTPHSAVSSKALNAKHHGAIGVLIMPDSYNHSKQPAPPGLPSKAVLEDFGVPTAYVTEAAGQRLIEASRRNLPEIHRSIHGHLTPYSFGLSGVTAEFGVDVTRVRSKVENVMGLLPGESDQYLILGAHYDHLGLGDSSSLSPDRMGEVHNGADDNASGTSGLLQLAQDFSGLRLKRNLLFIAFAGEEIGLLGSRHFTEHPTVPLEKVMAMINMDMIGRSQGKLVIGGVGTAEEFKQILQELEGTVPLEFNYSQTARGASDHFSFSLKKIPVLFFFSGLHSDYHKPTDDFEKIELERTEQILSVIRQTVTSVAELTTPLHYVDLGSEPAIPSGPNRGYGPRFGSLPDMGWESGGVRFSDVTAGSPAQKSGIHAGDILVEFDGKKIDNLYDFTYLLRAKNAGDTVQVVVLRDGKPLKVSVTLENR
ncbi:MAG: M28 family peptidase [Acidobacteria bacterium]|nr:M28 family peptidase [Acidobacteriota bacterium]